VDRLSLILAINAGLDFVVASDLPDLDRGDFERPVLPILGQGRWEQ
jgi:hypothetical protein